MIMDQDLMCGDYIGTS